MKAFRTLLLTSVLAFGSTACLVRGRVGGHVVTTSDPTLVEVAPGVWVIEDYNEPVFYADGFYWWYRSDGWYRSNHHTGGWVYIRSAPSVIVRIDRPRAYVNYRATAGVKVRSGPRGRVMVRDHRNQPRGHGHR